MYGFIFLCIITLIRNQLVFRWRTRKLDEVSEEARALIDKDDEDFLRPYRLFDNGPSYSTMVLRWDKWTYSSFYPTKENNL
jgi:hypothetical protein